ncbi:MAG: hypothetical protein H0T45_14975 [Pyrinomonadaceae bacterium]|nr:hypothetical protein [Pyrinomonadaceae bacterium]
MESPLVIVVIIAVGLVALLLAWRAVRFFLKMALLGIFLLALLVGIYVWSSSSRDAPAPPSVNRRPADTRRNR